MSSEKRTDNPVSPQGQSSKGDEPKPKKMYSASERPKKRNMSYSEKVGRLNQAFSADEDNEMEFLNHLDDEALIDKSARHFMDALEERRQRNDIDYHGKGLYFICLMIQNNWLFMNLVVLCTWVYIFLAFIEPAQLHEAQNFDLEMLAVTNIIELVILCVFACNFILEAILIISMYRYSSAIIHKKKNILQKIFRVFFVENLLSTSILVLDILFFIDFPIYVLRFPYKIFRFSRLFRPGRTSSIVKMMLHSVKMRKTIRGFINILPKVGKV
jgi:hypothetical protein